MMSFCWQKEKTEKVYFKNNNLLNNHCLSAIGFIYFPCSIAVSYKLSCVPSKNCVLQDHNQSLLLCEVSFDNVEPYDW